MRYLDGSTPLCEKPEWGQGWSRCEHIGVSDICMKFKEPLTVSSGGWVVRCASCATGGYIARSPECGEDHKEGQRPPRTGKFNNLREIRAWSRTTQHTARELLVRLLQNSEGRITKTKLITTANSFYWQGFVCEQTIKAARAVNEAFEGLCGSGIIIYEKGRSVTLSKK